MKKLGLIAAASLFAVSASAALYTDSVGDLNDGTTGDNLSGFAHLDFVSLEVLNDATDITFTFTLAGDISSGTGVDWGNYMIGLDTSSSDPGDALSNGWGRPINNLNGMDYWVGSWVNGGGGHQVWDYIDGTPSGSWSELAGSPRAVDLTDAASGSFSLSVPLADLGLSIGDTFSFDVYSSGGGGGDSAVDALANPAVSITTWSSPYESSANGLFNYTVVPEPASLSMLALGGLLAARIRRRR